MPETSDIEQKGLVEALDIEQEDLFEAKFNLLGFFEVLYRIDQRLRNEKKINIDHWNKSKNIKNSVDS